MQIRGSARFAVVRVRQRCDSTHNTGEPLSLDANVQLLGCDVIVSYRLLVSILNGNSQQPRLHDKLSSGVCVHVCVDQFDMCAHECERMSDRAHACDQQRRRMKVSLASIKYVGIGALARACSRRYMFDMFQQYLDTTAAALARSAHISRALAVHASELFV